jgi:hypothetical protein
MNLPWSKLIQIRDFIPFAELGVPLGTPVAALRLIGESPSSNADCRLRGWFRMADHQFFRTTGPLLASEPVDAVHYAGFSWAASDGAFASVLTGDSFFDDGASMLPPSELLRVVGSDRVTCYYRSNSPGPGERPICITVVPFRRPDDGGAEPRHAADGSQPCRPAAVRASMGLAPTADGDRSAALGL